MNSPKELTDAQAGALRLIDDKKTWRPMTVAEIEHELGLSDGGGNKVMKSLEREGLAVKIGSRWYSKRRARSQRNSTVGAGERTASLPKT